MTKSENGNNRGYVEEANLESYDGRYGPKINLGLARSPIGFAQELPTLVAESQSEQEELLRLQDYSKDVFHRQTKKTILEGLNISLPSECVEFSGNGSYGLGLEMVLAGASAGYQKIFVPNYSFPNVKQWADKARIEHIPLATETLNPLSSIAEIFKIEKRLLDKSIVYLDFPNNPFGLADHDLMKIVVDYVANNGGLPLIDLAFAEVFGHQQFSEVIQFVVSRGGIALCSVSKTQGLPGLRFGYGFVNPEFQKKFYCDSQRMVFGINPMVEKYVQILFGRQNGQETLAAIHAKRVASYNAQTNKVFYEKLKSMGVEVLLTNIEVPIQVLYLPNKPNFYQELTSVGIITESLADYACTLSQEQQGLGDRAVRILTPKPGETDAVIERIKKII